MQTYVPDRDKVVAARHLAVYNNECGQNGQNGVAMREFEVFGEGRSKAIIFMIVSPRSTSNTMATIMRLLCYTE